MNQLRNQRPKRRPAPKPMSISERKRDTVRGAQWSESLGYWIGHFFDGLHLTVFEGRTTRERALRDAHAHYDRVFHEERPTRRWDRTGTGP